MLNNSINVIVDALEKDFFEAPFDLQTQFAATPRDSLHLYHHGLGTQIRNKFGLWENKWEPEIVNGVDVSPNHPDAISMRVIEALWDRCQAYGK